MKRRLPAVILTVIMLASCVTCSPALAKSKAKSPALIKSVTVYDSGDKKQKWVKVRKHSYTYSRKYPKQETTYECLTGDRTVKSFAYTFRGKLPKKMTMRSSDSDVVYTYDYNKRGVLSRITSSLNEYGRSAVYFTYGTKRYFTSVLHDHIRIEGTPDGETEYDYAEELDSVAVTVRKSGLLKKTVNRGLFANYSKAENRKWERFDGVYTVAYDKSGIAGRTSAVFKTFPGSGPQLKFRVFRKNGLISKVIRYNWDPDAKKGKGAWIRDQLFVFKYTAQKIGRVRYASMINSRIMDEGNNYYIYNWY